MIYLGSPIENISEISVQNEFVKYLLFGIANIRRVLNSYEGDYVISSLKYDCIKRLTPNFKNYKGGMFADNMIRNIFGEQTYLSYQIKTWEKIIDFFANENKSKGILISAPTGFGKTEAFIIPLLQLLAFGNLKRIILIYPRVALLQDQLKRILKYLYNIRSNLSINLKVGIWYEEVPYRRMEIKEKLCREIGRGYRFKLTDCWCSKEEAVPFWFNAFPSFTNVQGYNIQCSNKHKFSNLLLSREDIINEEPQIILTTLESFELLLLTPKYSRLVKEADTVVFDEIHQYHGIYGSHASQIIRSYVEKIKQAKVLLIGASATVENPEKFAKKIFGLDNIEIFSPEDDDYKKEDIPNEHYLFLLGNENMPLFSTYIQTIMLFGHVFLKNIIPNGKILSFFDSKSVVHQLATQVTDAEETRRLWELRSNDSSAGLLNRFNELNWNYFSRYLRLPLLLTPLIARGFTRDFRPSIDELKNLDIILSTSILELGIDIPEIVAITQFRLPWDYTSFIQRKGRGGRRDKDSFIFLFLSNEPTELNIFYRAERFLSSSFVLPLNPENKVIRWIHKTLYECYKISREIYEKGERLENTHELFAEKASNTLGFKRFLEFLKNPSSDELIKEIIKDLELTDLFHVDRILDLQKKIVVFEEKLEERYKGILRFLDITIRELEAQTLESLKPFLLDKYKDACLNYLSQRQNELTFEKTKKFLEIKGVTSEINELLSSINTLRKDIEKLTASQFSKQALLLIQKKILEIHSEFYELILTIGESLGEFKFFDIEDIEAEYREISNFLTTLERIDEKNLEKDMIILRKIYYIKSTLNKLYDFLREEFGPHINLKKIKLFLQAMYQYWRYLKVFYSNLENIPQQFWYTPNDYFSTSLKTFLVTVGEKTEEYPIGDILFRFLPYKTEYVRGKKMWVLKAVKTEFNENKNILFFQPAVDGTFIEGIKIPEAIAVEEIQDVSEGRGIVKYCPTCYSLVRDVCPIHDEKKWGVIHSEPMLAIKTKEVKELEKFGNISLIEGSFLVCNQGALLQVTPAQFIGNDWIKRVDQTNSIEVRFTEPLGMLLETRGIAIDIKEFVENIIINPDIKSLLLKLGKIKNENDNDRIREIVLHTISHAFTILVANLAAVNPSHLFYHYDNENCKIYVIELTIGGQGIVDLFFDYLKGNTKKVYEELEATFLNCQIESETLFLLKESEFIDGIENFQNWITKMRNINYYKYLSTSFFSKLYEEFSFLLRQLNKLEKEVGLNKTLLLEIKKEFVRMRLNGIHKGEEKIIEFLKDILRKNNLSETKITEISNKIIDTLFPIDIDEGLSTLHLPYCRVPHDERERIISYNIGKLFFHSIIEYLESENVVDKVFSQKTFPAGEINGKWIFVSI